MSVPVIQCFLSLIQRQKVFLQRCCLRRSHHGVTLVEVIFSIGIVLTGLVGVAALIPVAANNARATLELDRGVSESTSAAAKVVAQSFMDLDSLVILDKPSVVPVLGSTNSMRTVDWKLNVQKVGTIELGKLESPGYGHMGLGTGLTSAICIDPIGVPDAALVPRLFASSSAKDSAFDYSRFPYYRERYDVLRSPNLPVDAGGDLSPRMWRATIKLPIYLTGNTPVQRHQLMSSASIRKIFAGSGGVSGFGTEQPEDPHSVFMTSTTLDGKSRDGGRENSSRYSWFMTLVPPFSGGNLFRQSIVVVRDRVAPVPRRLDDPTALKLESDDSVRDSDENPDAERLTRVEKSIGFVGGAGGEVLLCGSQLVSDKIQTGEWVMLSRQPHRLVGSSWIATNAAVHRWYRVLRVGETEYETSPDVWRRWVTLAGPDWAFQDGAPGFEDDTFCTIITGAVSVIENEVEIQ